MQIATPRLTRLLLVTTLAAAFASPAAQAQTSVTVSGLVDTFVGSMRSSGDSARSSVVGANGMTTSWWGFQGTEDLGGGLKANFKLTSFFRSDTGQSGRFPGNETMFSRDANVGLSGDFGGVSLGRGLAPNFLPMILFNPFGDSFAFSPLVLHMQVPLFNASGWANSVGGDPGWSNQILYTTPQFGGATVNLHYQFGEQAGNTGKNNVGANLLYFNGPLSLTAFYHRLKVNNPLDTPAGIVNVSPSGASAAQQTAWFIGGGYDLNVVKLFGSYLKSTHDIALDDKTYSLGLSAPIGSGKLLAAWAETKRNGTGFSDQKRDTISLGYDHSLSKRTDLYTVYMNDKISGFSSGNSVAAGIRHSF